MTARGPDVGLPGGPDGGPLGGPDGGPPGGPDGGPLGGPEGGSVGVSSWSGSDSVEISTESFVSSTLTFSSEVASIDSSAVVFCSTSGAGVSSSCDSATGSTSGVVSGTSMPSRSPNAPPNISSAAAFFSSSLDFSADVFGPATSSPHLSHRARLKYALSHGGLLPAWCSGLS